MTLLLALGLLLGLGLVNATSPITWPNTARAAAACGRDAERASPIEE